MGYLAQVTDALGRVTRYDLDSTTNLVRRVTDPAGRVTQYTYNQRGDLIRVIDPQNKEITVTLYDPKPGVSLDKALFRYDTRKSGDRD